MEKNNGKVRFIRKGGRIIPIREKNSEAAHRMRNKEDREESFKYQAKVEIADSVSKIAFNKQPKTMQFSGLGKIGKILASGVVAAKLYGTFIHLKNSRDAYKRKGIGAGILSYVGQDIYGLAGSLAGSVAGGVVASSSLGVARGLKGQTAKFADWKAFRKAKVVRSPAAGLLGYKP